jgi:hypothetical protein
VQFGLQFETVTGDEEAAVADNADAKGTPRPLAALPERSDPPAPPKEPLKVVEKGEEKDPAGAEVVRLDRFRKK